MRAALFRLTLRRVTGCGAGQAEAEGATYPRLRGLGRPTVLPIRPRRGYPVQPAGPGLIPSLDPPRLLMANTGASGSDLAIRALLGLLIIGLCVVLYFVTVVPAQRAAAAQRASEARAAASAPSAST